ncbi:MAG TPA: integrase [Planktothrix sp. UBA8407]|nr:integrase [Planktothrix sp. UBA8407]
MPKRNRNGQAATLTLLEVEKIYQSFSNERDRVIWMILSGTGERITAVLNLNVTDVYRSPSSSKIWDEITFPSSIRKKRPDGSVETRQVPIVRKLRAELEKFKPPSSGFLFPSPDLIDSPISRQCYDHAFRRALKKCGLDRMGFSLHSPRRTLATRLSAEGVPISVIQKITGHRSIAVLQKYIEVSDAQVKSAMDML